MQLFPVRRVIATVMIQALSYRSFYMKDKAQKNIKMHSVQFNFIMNAILTVSSFIFR